MKTSTGKRFAIKTNCAVKGWCDPAQRLFSDYDTRAQARRYAMAKSGLALKPSQFKIVEAAAAATARVSVADRALAKAAGGSKKEQREIAQLWSQLRR